MTMFMLPNFCRVCLKYDKNLIDLAHIENEPSETLMSKLQLCVSEVEWMNFKPLLCHPCIKRLNIAYGFKKQCVQSASVLKNYVELVKESQKKNEPQTPSTKAEPALPTTGSTFMLLPNQKYVKILVGPQNQGAATANTFQNVFLNLIPAASLNSVVSTTVPPLTTNAKSKDTNQNVFLNLNNTFQKFIPITTPITTTPTVPPTISVEVSKKAVNDSKANQNVNVNQLLTEVKSEELSVEIDPTIFDLDEVPDSNGEEEEEELNDYDEVISSAKITLKDFKPNGEKVQNGRDEKPHYVPILPKQDDFVTSGQHFLFASSENSIQYVCESCQKSFTTKKLLKAHINQFHLGKMPFKCEYCYLEYYTRSEYQSCLKSHHDKDTDALKSLTLEDFTHTSGGLDVDLEANLTPSENGEYICDVCKRPFNSSTGLLRHKVRKHHEKNKKKYFIKGMKNARCDICNRDFSTQSYMQLHKKLHLRDDIGYKYKVFGKSKYGEVDITVNEKTDKEHGVQKVRQRRKRMYKRRTYKTEEGASIDKQNNKLRDKQKEQDAQMDVDGKNSENEENSNTGEEHDTDD